MKKEKLLQILSTIGEVKSCSYNIMQDIVSYLKTGGNKCVISKKWHDFHMQNNPKLYPLILTDVKTWSTYHDCIDLSFRVNGKSLLCSARIYDGDSYSGWRKELKFTAELSLPALFVLKLRSDINCALQYYLEMQYRNHLQEEKQRWIGQLRNNILGQ